MWRTNCWKEGQPIVPGLEPSRDEETIRAWWAMWPTAGVGMIDEQSVGAGRLRPLDTHRLLTTDAPRVEWLIDGVVARGLLTLIVGREKTGKSLLDLAFAVQMASGGGELADISCTRGRVIIVDAENSEDEVHRRLRAMGMQPAFEDQLVIFEARGFDLRRDLELVEQELERHEPALVVLDAFRSLWGGKEVESDETAAALDPLRQLLHDRGVGGLLAHHARKADDEYRGNTGIGASVEHIITLGRGRGDPDRRRRRLRNPSSRFAAEVDDRWLRIDGNVDELSVSVAEPYEDPSEPGTLADELGARAHGADAHHEPEQRKRVHADRACARRRAEPEGPHRATSARRALRGGWVQRDADKRWRLTDVAKFGFGQAVSEP